MPLPARFRPTSTPKPQPWSGTRNQVRAGDTQGVQGPRKHTVCVFTVCFNLCPNPASYLASPYCTEQETEALDGQGVCLKPHGW